VDIKDYKGYKRIYKDQGDLTK